MARRQTAEQVLERCRKLLTQHMLDENMTPEEAAEFVGSAIGMVGAAVLYASPKRGEESHLNWLYLRDAAEQAGTAFDAELEAYDEDDEDDGDDGGEGE